MPLAALFVFLLALAPLGGCAWLLGHAEPPRPRERVHPIPAVVRASAGPLVLEATWLGQGTRIVTARNWLGRAARVVNPYGEDTFRIRLLARCVGAEPAVLVPERATLGDERGEPRPARTLADYRKRWPGWVVSSDEEEEDRRAAYEDVLGSLLIEREVAPGGETSGVLAFPVFTPVGKLVLTLPYRLGLKSQRATLVWEAP